MDKCYSDADIRQKLGNECRIMLYRHLLNFDNIDDALGPEEAMIILYEQRDSYGHWTCCFKDGDTIYFFDPYGIFPDDQLEEINAHYRLISGQGERWLAYLLGTSGYDIDYNNHELQSEKKGVNTCGRWSVARIKNKHLDSDEFAQLFEASPGVTPDQLVVAYTDKLF